MGSEQAGQPRFGLGKRLPPDQQEVGEIIGRKGVKNTAEIGGKVIGGGLPALTRAERSGRGPLQDVIEELQLHMLGEQLAIGNAAPELSAKAGINGSRRCFEITADMAKRCHDLGLPMRAGLDPGLKLRFGEAPATARCRPDTEQQQIDIQGAPLLQAQAGRRDVGIAVEPEGVIPELGGRKNR